ncbi:MAG: SRPBCC family protein [Anaerolineae bacterium]
MLRAEIKVNQSPQKVWKYFTYPTYWEKWWGGPLKGVTPSWQKGASLQWGLGGSSTIVDLVPQQRMEIGGAWMNTTFSFTAADSGSTVVAIEEGAPKGGASFSDGGRTHLAQLNTSLQKFKAIVEHEPEPAAQAEAQAAAPAVQPKPQTAAPAPQPQAQKAAPLFCPYCDKELTGSALITATVSLANPGVQDFTTNCPSCGKTIHKKDLMPTPPMQQKKWWEFWK